MLTARSKLVLVRAGRDTLKLGKRLDWYDLSRATNADGESAREYADRRLNQEILEYLVDPTCTSFTLDHVERCSAVAFLF